MEDVSAARLCWYRLSSNLDGMPLVTLLTSSSLWWTPPGSDMPENLHSVRVRIAHVPLCIGFDLQNTSWPLLHGGDATNIRTGEDLHMLGSLWQITPVDCESAVPRLASCGQKSRSSVQPCREYLMTWCIGKDWHM